MELQSQNSSPQGPSFKANTSESLVSREAFQFHGTGAEYFRIWIVNLLLTIITLGIYSAWAKVRRNRYIYGSLELAGSHFDYTASPLNILRGRMLAIVLLIAVIAAQAFMPLLNIGTTLLLFLVTPWLIVRSRMFNMRYTAYRNIRFGFSPAYGEAYKAIFLYGFGALVTLGALAPYAHFKRSKMIVGNTRFGNLRFVLGNVASRFYVAYALGFGAAVLLIAPLLSSFGGWGGGGVAGSDAALNPYAFILFVVAFLLYYVVGKFISALVLRFTTNATTIGSDATAHKLGCDWSLPGMLWIYLSNLVAIIFSFGLLTPWAQMRILRYQFDHTWIKLDGPIDTVIAGQAEQVSSLGEEIGEVFDVDIGL